MLKDKELMVWLISTNPVGITNSMSGIRSAIGLRVSPIQSSLLGVKNDACM